MGVAFYPVFDDRADKWPDDIDGTCLSRAIESLDKAAKKINAGSIYDFYSLTREQYILEALNADPDDPDSFDESKVQLPSWHDPVRGIRVINAMLVYLLDHPSQFEEYDCVHSDLEAFKRHLSEAASRGAKWHLIIDS